jgi:hypothetical protein
VPGVGKSEDGDLQVGIEVLVVGMGVVPIVLLLPPGGADSGQEGADDEAERIAAASGRPDLPVRAVVEQQREPAGDQPEQGTDERVRP